VFSFLATAFVPRRNGD